MSITCLPSRLRVPLVERLAERLALRWMQKSTWLVVPPNAADVWPDSTSSIVTVPPNGMSRCVCGSTQPGQHVLAARVDDPVGRDVERLADQGDPLALDEDVGDVVVGRGDRRGRP